MVQTRHEAAEAYLDTLPPPAEFPDARGRYGRFGGQYAPETLMPALAELPSGFREAFFGGLDYAIYARKL